MAQRGRGTLEVRESKDPFHVTTNSMYGIKLSQRQRHFDAPEVYRLEFHKQGLAAQSHFPFLYQKASSEIGKGISLSDSKLSKALAKEEHKADLARQASLGLRPKLVEATSAERCYVMDKAPERITIDPVTYLHAYEHKPRDHNPLYTTTSNDIGQKRPSMATVVTERMSRCQGFSNSFNSIKYRDQGLNCYMSRSKVHHELDPHFI